MLTMIAIWALNNLPIICLLSALIKTNGDKILLSYLINSREAIQLKDKRQGTNYQTLRGIPMATCSPFTRPEQLYRRKLRENWAIFQMRISRTSTSTMEGLYSSLRKQMYAIASSTWMPSRLSFRQQSSPLASRWLTSSTEMRRWSSWTATSVTLREWQTRSQWRARLLRLMATIWALN